MLSPVIFLHVLLSLNNIEISCEMIQFARHTSVYDQSVTCNCSIFSDKVSLSEILGQATDTTWWYHIDPFCPTVSSFLYSSLFPLQWPSSTPFQPDSLISMLAELIWEHLVRHSHTSALGFSKRQCLRLAWYRIPCLPPSYLRSRLDYHSNHSSQANCRCQKCFQMHCNYHIQLDDVRFFWFGGHLILQFILQGGPLQTILVAMVTFLTI